MDELGQYCRGKLMTDPRCTAGAFSRDDPFQKVPGGTVLLCFNHLDVDPGQSLRQRQFTEDREHTVLHAPSHRTTAEQEAVNDQGCAIDGIQHHADQAIVTKAVLHLNRLCLQLAALEQGAQGYFTTALAADVELIGPLRQLGQAIDL